MEKITVTSAGLTFPAYVGGASGAPAVIVVQEWWGVTDTVKDHALKIAGNGFRVLLPDIYKGKMGVDVEEAHHLMSNLDFPVAVKEICAAAAFLKSEGSTKVGITGFCMGGALTMGGLAASDDLVCGAPFYGVNFGLFESSQLVTKPVQGHWGQEDKMEGFSDPATGEKLAAELKTAGNAAVECFIYPGVGHAFMNEKPAPFESFEARQAVQGFPPYNAEQAELAWSRLLTFLKQHLSS